MWYAAVVGAEWPLVSVASIGRQRYLDGMRWFLSSSFGLLAFALAACTTASVAAPPTAADAGTLPEAGAGADAEPETSAACAELAAKIQPVLDKARAKARTTDIGVGLITRDCPFVPIVSGPSSIPLEAEFRIASITKTYTAAVILHFVESGAVALDDTVARFDLGLPNADQITVRQLLNHTSGLFNYTEDAAFPSHQDWTPRERLDAAAQHPTYFAPGKGWHYSNTNFVALGLIAEQHDS